MPIESHIDAKRRCIVARLQGDFTLEEVADVIEHSVTDASLRGGFCVLTDHTEIGEPLSLDQAEGIAEHLKDLRDAVAGVRWAAVTTKPASYGMLRMVAALVRSIPIELRVFGSRLQAEAWLFPETE